MHLLCQKDLQELKKNYHKRGDKEKGKIKKN